MTQPLTEQALSIAKGDAVTAAAILMPVASKGFLRIKPSVPTRPAKAPPMVLE